MQAVIQRVNNASVAVESKIIASINKGLLIFVGVVKGDNSSDGKTLSEKIVQLRIFNDQNGKMNLSALEIKAELLVVSQFTLCADVAKGRRPSFDQAAHTIEAEKLYLEFTQYLKDSQLKVEQGIFKEYMTVHIENDGPVTFVLNSKEA